MVTEFDKICMADPRSHASRDEGGQPLNICNKLSGFLGWYFCSSPNPIICEQYLTLHPIHLRCSVTSHPLLTTFKASPIFLLAIDASSAWWESLGTHQHCSPSSFKKSS